MKYFLGDNVNAIETQIWSCLIAHLLYRVILSKIKPKWAFSNLCDLIRQHLFTYTDLAAFLAAPERILRQQIRDSLQKVESKQLALFLHEGARLKLNKKQGLQEGIIYS